MLPIFSVAQSGELIELGPYGLKATMTNNGVSTVKEIEAGESDMKTKEVKVRFENSNRLTITELKKPLTVPMFVKMTKQALNTKSKTVKLKAIINEGNAVLVERTYIESGEKIYKCMYGVIIKTKHYLIDSDEVNDVETCKKMLEIAKSFKMN